MSGTLSKSFTFLIIMPINNKVNPLNGIVLPFNGFYNNPQLKTFDIFALNCCFYIKTRLYKQKKNNQLKAIPLIYTYFVLIMLNFYSEHIHVFLVNVPPKTSTC